MTAEDRVLCLAARTSVEADDERRLVQLLRPPLDWERLWAEAARHEVLPLVGATLRRLGERAAPPAGWAARVERQRYATLLRNTGLADALVEVTSAFEDSGVESLAVKGVALASAVYGDLALRPAADLDVVVRPADLPAARSVLRSLGFDHRSDSPGDEWAHSHHDEPYFRSSAGGEVCLELHWALWPAARFRADGGMWERARPLELRGATLRTLAPEDTLLHLAVHRTRAPVRLRSLCDVAELVRRDGSELDWETVETRGAAIGARTALFSVLSLSERLLAAPVPPGILARLGVGPLRRRILEPASGTGALFGPTASGPIRRQLRTGLRAFEHDGVPAIARALARRAAQKGDRLLAATTP